MGLSLHLKSAYEAGFNPFKSVVDDSQSSNPLQSFLDPGNVFGGLINGMPGLAPLPKMPSWAVKYLAFPTTKTNFGAFDTRSMQDTPNSRHPSIWEKSEFPSTPAAPPPPKPPTGTGAPPVNPNPHPPGGPGVPVQPMSRIFNTGSPSNGLAAHYASTPNTVVSSSAMTAPVVARPVAAR